MSLDIYLVRTGKYDDSGEAFEDHVYSANITHNLGEMARELGVYERLWRPEESGIERAGDLIFTLEVTILRMKSNPDRYRRFDSPNGWGTYKDFLPWLERLLAACVEHPTAKVRVSV